MSKKGVEERGSARNVPLYSFLDETGLSLKGADLILIDKLVIEIVLSLAVSVRLRYLN